MKDRAETVASKPCFHADYVTLGDVPSEGIRDVDGIPRCLAVACEAHFVDLTDGH